MWEHKSTEGSDVKQPNTVFIDETAGLFKKERQLFVVNKPKI